MLKVCVIGMGPIGNLHARLYQRGPAGGAGGVCDIRPDRADAAGQRWACPAFHDAAEMLAR